MDKKLKVSLIKKGFVIVDVPFSYLKNKLGKEFVSIIREFSQSLKVCFELFFYALENDILHENERVICVAGHVKGADIATLFNYQSFFMVCKGQLPYFKIIFSLIPLKQRSLEQLKRKIIPHLKRKNRKILAFGSFDLIHYGHITYLKNAKSLGSKLAVIITSDKLYLKRKGKKPIHTQQERKEIVLSLRFVDEAFISPENESPIRYARLISKIRPDIIALGYDLMPTQEEIRELYKTGIYPLFVRIPPYKPNKLKSSKLKNFLIKKIKS